MHKNKLKKSSDEMDKNISILIKGCKAFINSRTKIYLGKNINNSLIKEINGAIKFVKKNRVKDYIVEGFDL